MLPSPAGTAADDAAEGSVPDELTVVVVNWGTPDLTIRSVRALLDDGVPANRIVVVDNGSADDSYERFQAELPRCLHGHFPENVGYARAANAGARMLEGTAYLFVNNDAFVHRKGTIGALLRDLGQDSVGIVVPRILNEDLTLQATVGPTHTPGVSLLLASGLSRLVPNRWQPRWSTHWDHSESRAIRSASGVVMLVRRDVWKTLHGFHEGSTLYAVDIDLCWRACNGGWRVWFTTDAEFIHLRSGTTRRHWGDAKRAEMVGHSEALMIRRNLSPVSSRLTLGFIKSGLVLRSILFAALRRREASASVRGALRGYRTRSGE